MYLDRFLISESERLATGQYVHKVQNLIAAYKSSHAFAIDSGKQYDIDLFWQAERELLKFVAKRKLEKAKRYKKD